MSTSNENINDILQGLLAMQAENEIVEFKEAKNDFDFRKLGKYFSALSNEANLKRKPSAWLVFGVNNQRQLVGTGYRICRSDLDRLKGEVANKTTNRITFIEIHELQYDGKRALLLEIPAAPKGLPIAFDGHYFGRDGEELSPLNIARVSQFIKFTVELQQ